MRSDGSLRLGPDLSSVLTQGESIVLATVVKTQGHVYRRSGAHMLVAADGTPYGILSGGCIEGEICREAVQVLKTLEPKVLHFDLTGDEEYLVGYGKGCEGGLWVLLEPLTPALSAEARQVLLQTVDVQVETAVMIVYGASGDLKATAGARLVMVNGELAGAHGVSASLRAALALHLSASMNENRVQGGELQRPEGTVHFAAFTIQPVPEIVVFGAGPDAAPLVAIGAQLGWRMHVYDHRPAYIQPERLPGAASVERYSPDALGEVFAKYGNSPVVVMTHNLLVDQKLLTAAANHKDIAYIGLLGPAARRDRIFELAAEDGEDIRASLVGRLYAPIGLDLGGAGERDIALAVISQIQQLLHDRNGHHCGTLEASRSGRRNLSLTTSSTGAGATVVL